ncbi:LysR family transcriptional regulator [Rhizobium sp. KAs_5_22]|uniref:LysR substrate-binding domain-containing protein n=1 Tax=Ciceribacter selenitireducens TaxID=448181 RepID=UPI0004919F6D|nr:LysR substrate-binding domain-containing protein [Ciceribacter selenitireducens]PPJ45438.1 LysR family transcriptional regulator [Rhizobium sp. KAs_5_22]
METIDPELLRTFLAFADTGSLTRAAAIVGRSPSAITAQMQRLEAVIGDALLEQAGRGRTLTPTGEALVGHARRIIAAHREALLSLKGARADGRIALGCTQDFAESGLPDILRLFADTHPRLRLDLRIGRSAELASAFERGELDLALTMRSGASPDERLVLREPMLWLGAAECLKRAGGEVPLALLDAPCGFRNAAIAALDGAGRRYRIAATSASLSGLAAAVKAGIAVTARTARMAGDGIARLDGAFDLPALPEAEFALRLRPDAATPARDLADLLMDMLPSFDLG